jgi:D-alanyl-D-alanine carboxypeptidase/D-alanyl-D-alanine-endopeptidase (penicillin-binding protein 4)
VKAWQRGACLVGLAIAFASIDAHVARPQEDDTATPPSASDDAGVAIPPPVPVAVDAMPAPNDPQMRLQWLAAELAAIVHRHAELGRARIGAAFVDVATGKLLWGMDASGKYNLASCTKVLTSSAALARLGPGFKWRTSVYAESLDLASGVVEGDLYVRGRGDPTLDDAALRAIAIDVRRAGVRRVTGHLVVDDSYFDDVVDPPHYADQPKERSGYRAPVAAFGVDGNAVTVVIEPDPAGAAAGVIHLEPDAGEYVKIREGNVATVTEGRGRVRVDVRVVADHLELVVTGQVRADGGIDLTRRRIDDPAQFAGQAMRSALVAEGVTIGKRVTRGTVPVAARQVAAHESAPLADVVRSMNKFSNNFYAESILKTMGAEAKRVPAPPSPSPSPSTSTSTGIRGPVAGVGGPRASWEDGLSVVRDFLVHEVGMAEGSFRVENGSGLYGASDVSPLAMAQTVAHAERDFRYGPDLIASLAIAGVDGTLRKRLAGTPGAGRVRAKTGTLNSVSTLAGLLAVDGRHPMAFAILVNDIPDGARTHARTIEDELIGVALAYLGP